MSDQGLKRYIGRLTVQQVANGMNAARRNALRLVEDAELLIAHERWAGAVSQAILSIEETGKLSILRQIAVASNPKEIRATWRDYRSHIRKNLLSVLPEIVRKGGRSLEDYRIVYNPNAKHPRMTEEIKQLAMYTDYYEETGWAEPHITVEKDLSVYLTQTARLVVPKRETSNREIELWIEKLGPVWNSGYSKMKEALADWFSSMKEEGIISNENISIEDFIWSLEKADEDG